MAGKPKRFHLLPTTSLRLSLTFNFFISFSCTYKQSECVAASGKDEATFWKTTAHQTESGTTDRTLHTGQVGSEDKQGWRVNRAISHLDNVFRVLSLWPSYRWRNKHKHTSGLLRHSGAKWWTDKSLTLHFGPASCTSSGYWGTWGAKTKFSKAKWSWAKQIIRNQVQFKCWHKLWVTSMDITFNLNDFSFILTFISIVDSHQRHRIYEWTHIKIMEETKHVWKNSNKFDIFYVL